MASPQTDTVEWKYGYSVADLELMHRFCTDTYRSLCGDQTDMHDWQLLIPLHAYTHTFLLHGILAIAALHVAATATDPSRVSSYLNTALHYNERASAPFRQALNYLTPRNCDAVFAHSAIVTVIGIALPRLNAGHRGECFSMVDNMVTVFELLQGSSKISRISRPWLKANMFSKYDFWTMEDATLDPHMADAIEQLVRLNNRVAHADAEQHRTNHDAIKLLRSCFAKFVHSPHPGTILAWLVYVRKEFVDGLRLRQPFPLLILMHWGVLLNELGGQFWWARECGKDLVVELLSLLKEEHEEWNRARFWPQCKVGV